MRQKGLKLPRIGLGTAPLGGLYESVPREDALAAIEAAIGVGYRWFDTAPLYGYGRAEDLLGEALEGTATIDTVVSTKVGRIVEPDAERQQGDIFAGSSRGAGRFDFSADGVRSSLEGSLTRLRRDRVEVALIHDPDDHFDQAITDAYPTLEAMRHEGMVDLIGIGMNQTELPTRFIKDTDIDLVLVSGRYTLLDHSAGADVLPAAKEHGVHYAAAGIYNSGILTDVEDVPHYDYAPAPDHVVETVRRLRAACLAYNVALPTAAVQFPLAVGEVNSILIGARSADEVVQNWQRAQQTIPDGLWAEIAEINRHAY